MPNLKRKTSHVPARKPFGAYDGPTPPPGNYPGVIRSVGLRSFDSGTQCFNVLVELEADADSPKAEFNGFNAWTKLFLGESEFQIARENAFYQAICGQSDVTVVFDDKSEKKEPPITKIGGVSPVGKKVRVQLQLGQEYQGRREIEGDSIYPFDPKATKAAPAAGGDPDADIVQSKPAPEQVGGAETDDDAVEVNAAPVQTPSTASTDIGADDVDYHALNLPLLRAYAAEHGVDVKVVKSKAAILAALDAQGSEGGEESGDFDPKTAADLEAASLAEILAWAQPKYDEGDLDGMKKEELVALLLDDEEVAPF